MPLEGLDELEDLKNVSPESLDTSLELPDDSGEVGEMGELPDDFGESEDLGELPDDSGEVKEPRGLSDQDKINIEKETDWSPKIVNCIESMDQYEVYKNAGLHEAEINGRKCLVKDIDMDYVDPKTVDDKHPEGMSNRELMGKGRPPYDAATGERLELHHMGQDFNSPFAELAENSEHGDGKDAILHDKKVESWRQYPEKKNQYNNVQRPNHWKARAKEM